MRRTEAGRIYVFLSSRLRLLHSPLSVPSSTVDVIEFPATCRIADGNYADVVALNQWSIYRECRSLLWVDPAVVGVSVVEGAN